MTGGTKILLLGSSLLMTGCVTDQAYQVRPIADPAAKFRYAGSLIAQGRAQLALGNVGLALETFRKAQREQPPSADTFAGIAACYSAMGRHDLARSNYEFALAYAPNDPMLLYALASSLERLGEGDQAGQVRAEAARLTATRVKPTQSGEVQTTQIGVPRLSSITVKVPTVVAAPKPVAPKIPPPQLTAATVSLPAPSASDFILRQPTLRVDGEISIAVNEEPSKVPVAPSPSIAPPRLLTASVDLPAARPAVLPARAFAFSAGISIPVTGEVASRLSPVLSTRQPTPRPAAVRNVQVAETDVPATTGPYLQRKSQGEVSLITTAHSVKSKQLEADIRGPLVLAHATPTPTERPNAPSPQALLATAVRWVPLRFASAPQNVVLLNAARSQGLAARTRNLLAERGWRSIGIGNARRQRERSLVLYPAARAFTAQRLAAHFGCKAIKTASVKAIVVLLGRETAPRRSSRA
jgi:hypothetical protein